MSAQKPTTSHPDQLTTIAASIDAGVAAIESQLDLARASLSDVRARMYALTGEIERLREMPVNREDFIKALEVIVHKRARVARNRIEGQLATPSNTRSTGHAYKIHPAAVSMSAVECVMQGEAEFGPSSAMDKLLSHLPYQLVGPDSDNLDVTGLIGILEDQWCAGLRRSVELIEWPYGAPPSIAERKAQIEGMERELGTLSEAEAKLTSMIERAGSIGAA